MRLALPALALLCSSCAWSAHDVALAVAETAVTSVDWHQTRTTVAPQCWEANPVIGSCGQRVNVDVYFPVMMGLSLLTAALLPDGWMRTTLLATETGVEANAVITNRWTGAGW